MRSPNIEQIEYSLKFSAPETDDQFLGDLEVALVIESRRLIYVAMTREREKFILEWPSYLAGNNNLTYWSILTGKADIYLAHDYLQVGEVSFPFVITEGDSELPGEIDLHGEITPVPLSTIGRLTIQRESAPDILTPESVTSFEVWLAETFDTKSIARELPLLAIEENGSVISGAADLVLKTDDGGWIFDHKSDRIDDPKKAFAIYRPQLESYAKSLASDGENVLGTGINGDQLGVVVLSHA